jgi:hypothetical protein
MRVRRVLPKSAVIPQRPSLLALRAMLCLLRYVAVRRSPAKTARICAHRRRGATVGGSGALLIWGEFWWTFSGGNQGARVIGNCCLSLALGSGVESSAPDRPGSGVPTNRRPATQGLPVGSPQDVEAQKRTTRELRKAGGRILECVIPSAHDVENAPSSPPRGAQSRRNHPAPGC